MVLSRRGGGLIGRLLGWAVLLAIPPAVSGENDTAPACECGAPVEEASGLPFELAVAFGVILLALSGCFSGLTLGLLGLDNTALKAIADAPIQVVDPMDSADMKRKKEKANKDREAARKIVPLRRKGNLLLCTLLLGNVMVNVMIPILLAGLTGGLFGFIFSTMFIVIFGEIVPQATCSRYALQIGAMSIPLVSFFKVLLLPLTWPIAWVLDRALGVDVGQLYDSDQIATLMMIHMQSGHLMEGEHRIIQRGLQLQRTSVAEVMTYQRDVYVLDADDVLTEERLTEIWQKGHSRIPVIEQEPLERPMRSFCERRGLGRQPTVGDSSPQSPITSGESDAQRFSPIRDVQLERRDRCMGILYAKDLITVRPEDKLTVRKLISFYHRDTPPSIDIREKLDKVLNLFQSTKVHMFIVTSTNSSGLGDPVSERMGIITLEDVLEHLVGGEFVDEHDVVEDVSAKDRKLTKRQKTPIMAFRKQEISLTSDEAFAVANFLVRGVSDIFAHLQVEKLAGLLRDTHKQFKVSGHRSDFRADLPPEDSPAWLYRRGEPLKRFTLVLSGELAVRSGHENFTAILGAFQYLGKRALEKREEGVATCDFEAYVQEQDVRYIQLDTTDLLRLQHGQVSRHSRHRGPSATAGGGSDRERASVHPPRSPPLRSSIQAHRHYDPGVDTAPDSAQAARNASGPVYSPRVEAGLARSDVIMESPVSPV